MGGELTLAQILEGPAWAAFAGLALWIIKMQNARIDALTKDLGAANDKLVSNLEQQIETMAVAISKIGGGDA